MLSLSDCLQRHVNTTQGEQQAVFEKVAGVVLNEQKDFASVPFPSLCVTCRETKSFAISTNSFAITRSACMMPFTVILHPSDLWIAKMGMQQNKVLILVLSVICKKENETYAIPLKIRIYTMEPRMTMLPDVFLFYDESSSHFLLLKHSCVHQSWFQVRSGQSDCDSVDGDMESANCPFSSILSSLGPRSEATDRRPHLCILGVSSASSYVRSSIFPSLCRKESLIPNSDITHRMYALHSPRELQTGKADRSGSLWNGISGV